MKFVCQCCGVDFERDLCPAHLKRNPPKFCSRKCRDEFRRTGVHLVCVQCGKKFYRKAYMADWSKERGPFCGFDCYGQWQSANCRSENNPNYNPDARKVFQCSWCGQEFERRILDHGRNDSGSGNAFCSRDCFQEYAKKHYPAYSYHWSSKTWKRVRLKALERDNYSCQHCGSAEDLVVHHIVAFADYNGNPSAHELDNLVTLCRACHHRLHNQS